MNILVNGCSFSRGPGSWPYVLQNLLGANLVNLAQAGAGNTYIYNTTMSELFRRKYNMVVVMWSGIHRVDFKVEKITSFPTPYTSAYQLKQNDWPEKIIVPVNDQDYVEPNWVFGCGHINNDQVLTRDTKLFETVYKYVGSQEMLDNLIIKMVALQNTLKLLDIPYVFSFYEDYAKKLMQHEFNTQLDWNCVCNSDNINNIVRRNKWFAEDNAHPGDLAHTAWANIVHKHIGKYHVSAC